MFFIKNCLFLIVLLSAIFLNAQVSPMTPMEFDGDAPDWMHITVDSLVFDGINYDGASHLIKRNHPLYVDDKNSIYSLYHMRNLYQDSFYIQDYAGILIEKLDKNSGALLWTSRLDVNQTDLQEVYDQILINEKGNLEIVGHRRFKTAMERELVDDWVAGWYRDGGDTSTIVVREFSTESGDHIFSNVSIYSENSIIHSPDDFNDNFTLYKEEEGQYSFIKVLREPNAEFSNIIENVTFNAQAEFIGQYRAQIHDIDTFILFQNYTQVQGIFKRLNRDTLVHLVLLKEYEEFLPDHVNLRIYDRDMNIQLQSSLSTQIPFYFNSMIITKIDKNFIYLYVLDKEDYRLSGKYYIVVVSYDGIVQKILPSDFEGGSLRDISFASKSDGTLLLIANHNKESLVVLQALDNNEYHLVKRMDYINEETEICSAYSEYSEEGDLFIQATQDYWDNFGEFYVRFIGWHLWMKISSEDLDIVSSTKSVNAPIHELKIFPNPVINSFQVSEEELGKEYQLWSMEGRLMQNGLMNNNQIDISGYMPGTYFLRILSGDTIKVGKIIKI